MKRLSLAASLALAVVLPGIAEAKPPTPAHARQYLRQYAAVRSKLGHRAPGRNIIRWGFDAHHRASDAQVVTSMGVLERMLAPPAPVPVSITAQPTSSHASPGSGLAACILQRESSNGTTSSNIAQWQGSAWAIDGGTQYAPTPEGATYGQQVAVLNHALATGHSSQWTPYDGC